MELKAKSFLLIGGPFLHLNTKSAFRIEAAMSDKEKLCDQFHQNEGFYDYLDAVVVAKVEIEIDGQLFQVGFNDKSHTLIFFNPRTKRMFIAALEDMLRVAIENGLDDGDSPAPAGHSITERRFQPPPIVEEGEEKHRFQP